MHPKFWKKLNPLLREISKTDSSYWNFGIGRNIGEVLEDTEGLETMKILGQKYGLGFEKGEEVIGKANKLFDNFASNTIIIMNPPEDSIFGPTLPERGRFFF